MPFTGSMEIDISQTQDEVNGFSKWLQGFSARLHRGISNYFGWHGTMISRRPWIAIIACLILSITCSSLYFSIMKKEMDPKDLFTPKSAQAFKDEDYYEKYYGKPPSQTRLLITRNVDLNSEGDCKSRSVLPDDEHAKWFLLEFFKLYDAMMNITIEHKGTQYQLDDLCIHPVAEGGCQIISVLDAWNNSQALLKADPHPTQTLQRPFYDAFGMPLSSSYLVGVNNQPSPCHGNLEAFQCFIIMKYESESINGNHYDPKVRKWNEAFVHLLTKEWKSENLTFYTNNNDAINQQSEKTLEKDQKLLWVAYFLVLGYCHMALFKNSYSHCKSHLAIVSCLSVIMAIYSAYGIAQIFGIKFNPVHRVLPFLLMGLGVDDTFVIMSAYHATDTTMSAAARIKSASMRAGSAILITSVTDFVAFLSGIFTSLSALQDFSIYAAIGILMDFLYQMTFFLAFLALEARRERERYEVRAMDLENLPVNGHSPLIGSALKPMDENGVSQEEDSEDALSDDLLNKDPVPEPKICGHGNYTPTPSITTRIAGLWLPKISLHPIGKIVVSVMELILIGFAIYGCTKVKMDFRFEEWFVPKGSFIAKAQRLEKMYFRGNQMPFHALTKGVEPNDHFKHQDQLSKLASALRSDPYVAPYPEIHSWYEDFMKFAKNASNPALEMQNSTFQDPVEFRTCLVDFLNGVGAFYNSNVIFNSTGEKIVTTRISGFTNDIKSGSYAVHTVDSLRKTVKRVAPDLDPVVYSYGFLYYDGYRVIAWETIRNVMLAAAAVFLMTLVILANLTASISVLLMVALTDIMLFGLMWYVDLTFNSVTCICMVLAVGIAVDYSVHVAHTFMVKSGTRQRRAEKALNWIGGAVLNGAFTTLLAVLVLGFADHYILRAFFKMFLGIVICGAWHGLVILPVVLSTIGPKPYSSRGLHP